MNKYFKLAMFYTSFLPLWITVVFNDILSISRNKTCLYAEYIGVVSIIVALALSLIVIVGSIKNFKTSDFMPYRINEAIQEKGITSEYLLSYILPLFAFDFTQWVGVVEFLIYFIILAFLCVRNNNVYANLFLEFKNYKFYNCEVILSSEPNTKPIQTILISNKNLTAYKGNTVEIASLNKPFYIVKDSQE